MKAIVINAVAPTRICDVGGWTDTHFAGFGAVFNVAIYPYVEVQIHALAPGESDGCLVVAVENYGTSYALNPKKIIYDKHPLIEAAIKCMGIPRDQALRINIFSHAPPGASTGTSAAVSVALIGALDALVGARRTLHETAVMAHSIETKELGLECGVQDQLASAHGGINLIEIPKFPRTVVRPVRIPDPIWWELENRLVLTYIGQPHNSSAIHKLVIKNLGKSAHKDLRLEGLRKLAYQAKAALVKGDFAELGRVFNCNTAIQRELHNDLICEKFEEIIGIAEDFHALGCKVNGAGGDGGSIAILASGEMWEKRKMQNALVQKGFNTIPIYLSRRGLRVWKTSATR